jgi:hypothetical protein
MVEYRNMVWGLPPMLVGDREITGAAIDLDCRAMIAAIGADTAAATPLIGADIDLVEKRTNVLALDKKENLDAAAAGRALAVALDGGDDLGGPVGDQAVIEATVEVETAQIKIGAEVAEYEPDAPAGVVTSQQSSCASLGFGIGTPRRRIGAAGIAAAGAVGDFGRFVGGPARLVAPGEPAWTGVERGEGAGHRAATLRRRLAAASAVCSKCSCAP